MKMLSFKEVHARHMKDPEFRREFEAIQPELALIELLMDARLNKGVTQAELAKKMGTKQSAISRFESGRINPRLDFMIKLASALGARIKIEKV